MEEIEHHEMYLEATYPSGAEQWFCPTCGRRFVMRWPPAYSMTIIDAGDEHAHHSGGKGGLRVGPARVIESEQTAPIEEQDWARPNDSEEREQANRTPLAEELGPWLKWMKEAGLYDDDHAAA